MKVNINELKLKDIRRTISIQLNGEEREIKILNLTNKTRVEFINKFRAIGEETENQTELTMQLFEEVYRTCTDLEIDEDFMDVLNNPSVELMQVQMEIQEIIHELQCEEMISRIGELNQVESMLYAQLSLKKSERVENLIKLVNGQEDTDTE